MGAALARRCRSVVRAHHDEPAESVSNHHTARIACSRHTFGPCTADHAGRTRPTIAIAASHPAGPSARPAVSSLEVCPTPALRPVLFGAPSRRAGRCRTNLNARCRPAGGLKGPVCCEKRLVNLSRSPATSRSPGVGPPKALVEPEAALRDRLLRSIRMSRHPNWRYQRAQS